MRTIDLIREVNELADENESNAVVLAFLNQALAKISVESSSELPYLTLSEDDRPVIPQKWQRVLLIPFAVGRIKQKDSSQFEYTDAYAEFMNNLDTFLSSYTIPIIYRVLETGRLIRLENGLDYEVQEGDTLFSIANEFGMSAIALRDLNFLHTREDSFSSNLFTEPPLPWFNF